MERLVELKSPPIVGNSYLVPSVWMKKKDQEEYVWMPIIGEVHSDHDIGVTHIDDHIHVDLRFVSDEDMIATGYWDQERLDNRHSVPILTVMGPKGGKLSISEIPMTCRRDQFPTSIWFEGGKDRLLEKAALKLQEKDFRLDLNCKTCPHKGTRLDNVKSRFGIIQCPAHGMRFLETTGELCH